MVGVVADVRHQALDRAVLSEIYHPLQQRHDSGITIVARTADPTAAAPIVRSMIKDLPERVISSRVTPFADIVDATTLERRNRAVLLSVLGALGLLLASVGVFGVTAYSVSQRTKEIGVRMALGADSVRVLRTVIGPQLMPIGFGVAVGMAGSWWATRALGTFLFGVKPTDPVTFASVALIITVAGLAGLLYPGAPCVECRSRDRAPQRVASTLGQATPRRRSRLESKPGGRLTTSGRRRPAQRHVRPGPRHCRRSRRQKPRPR